jgi:drug/metabolite transporter (DMT)-like permease
MNPNPSSDSRPHRWRRWIPPAAAVGVGGTSLVIWFEQVTAFVTEFIGVILLPVLAGVIYLFNHYLFKSATPKASDIKKDRSN